MPSGGDEANSHANPEPFGPTYDVVMSDKHPLGRTQDGSAQGPHWMGQLVPPAIPRTEERVSDFWDGASVLRDDSLRLRPSNETMTMNALNDKDAQAG